jgi:hypothetical protein
MQILDEQASRTAAASGTLAPSQPAGQPSRGPADVTWVIPWAAQAEPRQDAARLPKRLLRSIVVLARLGTLRSHLVVKITAVAEVLKEDHDE